MHLSSNLASHRSTAVKASLSCFSPSAIASVIDRGISIGGMGGVIDNICKGHYVQYI